MTHGATGSGHGYQRGQMPNALRIGLLGPLQVRDETGRPVRVGGRQLRVLLSLLALNAGRVVPAGSLDGHIWPDDPPGNLGNALQTLVSRLRAELRQGGICDVIESHPAGYRLAVPPDAVDATAFERLAGQGRHALAGGDAAGAARILRDALLSCARACWPIASRPTWLPAREPAWSASCACCSPPTRWPNVRRPA